MRYVNPIDAAFNLDDGARARLGLPALSSAQRRAVVSLLPHGRTGPEVTDLAYRLGLLRQADHMRMVAQIGARARVAMQAVAARQAPAPVLRPASPARPAIHVGRGVKGPFDATRRVPDGITRRGT